VTGKDTNGKTRRPGAMSVAVLAVLAHVVTAAEAAPLSGTRDGGQAVAGPAPPRASAGLQLAQQPTSEEELDAIAIKGFQLRFDELNQRVAAVMGEAPFQSAESLGERTIRIKANRSWIENTPHQKRRNAMVLYKIWRDANGSRTVKVIIADQVGIDDVVVSDLEGQLTITMRR
jgi:hypothetical protein